MAVREVAWPRDVAGVARALARAGDWFWLDGSAPEPDGESGRSYLGVAAETRYAESGAEGEFLSALRSGASDAGVPCGWVMALGYEFGVGLMGEHPASDDVAPAFALRADTVLSLDHAARRAELHGATEPHLDRWLQCFGGALETEDLRTPGAGTVASKVREVSAWRRSDARYAEDVEKCLAAIGEGDAYVLCLTDLALLPGADLDPLELYLRCRATGGAVRGAVITAGQRALVSLSPERFLSKRGNSIATHPIKGTRPRSANPVEDRESAEALVRDPKERAENLMIVDLMRNDLTRVCEPSSVGTTGFLRVESHPRVHQLVSTVSGTLLPGRDVYDAIEACFPGGSMTGAPKRRAVQILAALEAAPRGLYSGCFGWVGADGDAELAMTIRSVELRGLGTSSAQARIGAGGGVTADSQAPAEVAEKNLKAAPLLAAVSCA